MKPRLPSSVLSALAIIYLSSIAAPQATTPDSAAAIRPPIVNIPFFAEEGHRKPRTGITLADLSILHDGKPPQSVVAIQTSNELPLRLGVLIDTSNSQRASRLYRPGVAAINDLLSRVLNGPDDKVFIVNFSGTVEATGFMGKEELLTFKTNANPGGGTAFFDALYFSCKDRMESDPTQPARRVLVALTDGGDNMSRVSHDEAITAALRGGAVIFVVSTGEPGTDLENSRLLELGEKTGGHAFLHLSPGEIPKAFRSIEEQIGNMYVVSYIPHERGKQGERHTIELKTTSDKKLKFRAPKAYYPPPSAP
jgi:Ca-activated chloride channel family protein